MTSYVWTALLAIGAVYSFYEQHYVVGVLLLVWSAVTVFRSDLQRFGKAIVEMAKHSSREAKSNCSLQFTVGLESVFKHDSTISLLKRLQAKGIMESSLTDEAWSTRLLQNYRKKYAADTDFWELKFNIKNNLLWKDGEIDFRDIIHAELFIPYDDPDAPMRAPSPNDDFETRLEMGFLPEGVHAGLTIRIFVVNGILKLQIGKFSKSFSPEVAGRFSDEVSKGSAVVYRTHATITSFPLLYFSHRLGLPEAYLNLSAYATDAYRERNKDRKANRKSDYLRDWKQVLSDVADYNYVCSVADEYVEDRGRFDKITKRFELKREQWLKAESFVDLVSRRDDQPHYAYDDRIHFSNKMLMVFVVNFGSENYREWKSRHSTDYYEEGP
jgi:hypothetical protein